MAVEALLIVFLPRGRADTRPQYMGRGRYMRGSRLRDKAGPTRRGFIMLSIYGSLVRWTRTMSAYGRRVIDGVRGLITTND